MDTPLDSVLNALNDRKKTTALGGEYWMGRDIQSILGYETWENFNKVINKAQMACESTGISAADHFRETTKGIVAGKGALMQRIDFFLTRYACYLIAMNGDSNKPQVGMAQTYFAVQTRRQEKQDMLTAQERRLQLRDRVKNANKNLNKAAQGVGVKRYALFHDAGYKGLYEMGLSSIKSKKGIPPHEELMDRAGRAELAANEFRITQTEGKLMRGGIHGEQQAIRTHHEVGREVRSVIKKLSGIMPEELPAEESIKNLIKTRSKKRIQNQAKIEE